DDRRGCKQHVTPHLTACVAKILAEAVKPSPRPDFAAGFGHARWIPELTASLRAGFRFGHPGIDEIGRALFQMRFDLRAQMLVAALHGSTAFITRPMPSSIRSKLDTSRSSCLRPAGVILYTR